jgi:hypothetical protein
MDKEEKKEVKEEMKDCCKEMRDHWHHHHHHRGGSAGAGMVYCLGLIGAAVYYFQHAVVTMDYVYGFLKALVWPAFLIHKVFTMLQM